MNLIYIAGDDRSGSTMLDMMLSGHSEIVSVGECHQLKAYAKKDKSYYKSVHEMVCYCGESLDKCRFWVEVEKRLGKPLESLILKPFFMRHELANYPVRFLTKKIMWLFMNSITPAYSTPVIHSLLNGNVIGKDSCELYEAVSNTVSCKYVLDSSKDPHRMYSIAKLIPNNVKVILLCRDFKGTIYSKSKRGMKLTKAALQWKWTVNHMEYYRNKLTNVQFIRVKYEDVCNNTKQEIKRICDFLELEYQSSLLNKNTENLHHLGGSPSKYNRNLDNIRIDQSYQENLTKEQIDMLYGIVKKQANMWAYTK